MVNGNVVDKTTANNSRLRLTHIHLFHIKRISFVVLPRLNNTPNPNVKQASSVLDTVMISISRSITRSGGGGGGFRHCLVCRSCAKGREGRRVCSCMWRRSSSSPGHLKGRGRPQRLEFPAYEGMLPVMWFLDRFKISKPYSFVNSWGNLPDKLFPERSPKVAGMLPLKLLSPRSRICNEVKFESSEMISPVNELDLKIRILR
ncbi:hypothetical protein G2W53_022728 [Senna tora]|uniref:Uncharacterized protein n=1 Tax=Senna tora TaxID=362788 RepID=A0A834WPE9_9FABA|nr:hypothetical protein G2W53_022728 [Senna tora]